MNIHTRDEKFCRPQKLRQEQELLDRDLNKTQDKQKLTSDSITILRNTDSSYYLLCANTADYKRVKKTF